MSDHALTLLLDPIRQQQTPALWVLDEHGGDIQLPPANPTVQVVSNRKDVSDALLKKNWPVQFSDYDFSHLEAASLDRVFFRLAKEKPVVHHVINHAARLLKTGGQLLLSGGKQQGIKTYAKNAAKCLGGKAEVKKQGNDYLATITLGASAPAPLDEKDYTQLRPIAEQDGLTLYSKPGQYGWDKIDAGSALLAAHLNEFLPYKQPGSILDLGCGYGYLSLMAHRLYPEAALIATDNNAAALAACRKNFTEHTIQGEVIADNCGEHIPGRFRLVICNPPFHQGFDVEGDLTERFVKSARAHLKHNGVAAFVVNAFIPIERIARQHFSQIEVVVNDGKFKLVKMEA